MPQSQLRLSLHKFLSYRNVSKRLTMRILKNATHAFEHKTRSQEAHEVHGLQLISEPMSRELHLELNSPTLTVHPFLEHIGYTCPVGMRHTCHEAVSSTSVFRGDVVFSVGEEPTDPSMIFLQSGALSYFHSGEKTEVLAGAWLAEAALWATWQYRGALKAAGSSRLLLVHAHTMHAIMRKQVAFAEYQEYAKAFIEDLNAQLDNLTDLGDAKKVQSILDDCLGTEYSSNGLPLQSHHRHQEDRALELFSADQLSRF